MSSESNAGTQTVDNRWIPLESNPEVFNAWAEKAGLATSLACFHDLYGLDDELLALVPQPVKAVVLLFPLDEAIRSQRKLDEERVARDGQPLLDKSILWIKQTIGNACGTMALLHALSNTDVTINPGSALAQFIEQCKDKTPLERAQLLETTPLFTNIHAEMAAEGQTSPPSDLDTDLHFTCFVAAPSEAKREALISGLSAAKSGMRLIELDGGRNGPIDRGKCDNLLKDAAKFVNETYFTRDDDSVLFALMALAPPQHD
ncbi:hypothetical protein AX14_010970 [Amanita brunnescens Koide BX004]|nr:hypothetical protein AX14_010970 [Amanita brunnescens Koide BX004]